MKYYVSIIFFLISSNTFAVNYSIDSSGVISNIYARENGVSGFKLQGGSSSIPNAVNKYRCGHPDGWMIANGSDKLIKSYILAAKMTGKDVTVVISGCGTGDYSSWYKIRDIYIN